MLEDIKIGRELAAWLNTKAIGNLRGVEFTYDPWIDFEDMPEWATVFISPGTFEREVQSRKAFRHDCVLYMVMITEQAINLDADWMDAWLSSWDELLDTIEDAEPLGNPVVAISQEDRYDSEVLHKQNRLILTASIGFNLINKDTAHGSSTRSQRRHSSQLGG